MKVLHIISGDLWAGAEMQACTLLASLHQRPDMQVAAALMNDGELARRLRAHGIPVTVFPESQLDAGRIFQGLRRLMKDWRPDIVHTHRSKENILGSIANRFSGRAPSVRTAHGANEHHSRALSKQFLRWLDAWCGNHLQRKVIAVSSDLAGLLTRNFPAGHIVTIENGLDAETVRAQIGPVDFSSAEPGAIHIGIVGRLVPVKRVDLFLEMAAALRNAHPQRRWRFHVFGDGPLRSQLVTQAAHLQVADVTTFHGHRADIIASMAALDMLVMCSDHEGLPMTLLEALAAGTPIAAHAVGGITQVLKDSAGCVLVEKHDAHAYAAAVEILLDRSDVRPTLPPAYSAIRNSDRVSELYRQLLPGRAA